MTMEFQSTREELLARFGTDSVRGLTSAQVAASAARYGTNTIRRPKPPSLFHRIVASLMEPMMLLLLGAALIAVGVNVARALGDAGGEVNYFECAGIFAAIVLSVTITLVMEGRSAKAFEALSRLNADVRVRTVRNGSTGLVPLEGLVVGDLVLLGTGDRVPADGRLLAAAELRVDESSLTGESKPVAKDAAAVLPDSATPVAERRNMAFSGGFVTGGTGRMLVTAVGGNTEFGHIARELAHADEGTTPLQEKLRALGKRVALFGMATAVLAFLIQLAAFARTGELTLLEVADAFVQGILLVVAAVPEGLPTTAAIALSITVLRLAREHALVRKMVACETAGRVSVICSDKTGTLTENRMTVVAVRPPSGSADVAALHENACVNSTADVDFGAGGPKFVGNPTECALIVAAQKAGIGYRERRAAAKVLSVVPFSSDAKSMATVTQTASGPALWLKGSPERVLARCALDAAARAAAEKEIASYQERACRVIAFAHGAGADPAAEGLVYDGFAAITDPLRPEVQAAVAACRSAGIELKMLTGDNLVTARTIARELGVLDATHRAVTAAEIESLPDDAFARALESVRVIARSTPLVKLRVVRALKAAGEVVAVTGDGINDAPAVKCADVGIAMGVAGTEVTKEASDIVLLDDSFATIVKAVKWGRGLYDNFRRFIEFQLTVNVSAVLVVLTSVSFSALGLAEAWGEPFTALELLWINIVMDGPPALTLGLEPVRDAVMARQPARRSEGIVPRDMAARIAVNGAFIAAVFVCQQRLNFLGAAPGAEQKSALFTLFVVFQLFNAFNCRALGGASAFSHLLANRAMLVAFGLTFLLQAVITQFGQPFFGTVPLSGALWAKVLLTGATVLAVPSVCRLARGFLAGVFGRRAR